jgi:hypothetical protein
MERVMTPHGVVSWRTRGAEHDITKAIILMDHVMKKLAHTSYRSSLSDDECALLWCRLRCVSKHTSMKNEPSTCTRLANVMTIPLFFFASELVFSNILHASYVRVIVAWKD